VSDFAQFVDLASERLGGRVLAANDEFFAPKENLLKAAKPIFLEHKYTDRVKWMDGWETRRRREPGFDSCLIRLGLPGIIRGVVIDTSYFRGNYPEHCSIEACGLCGKPSGKSELEQLASAATQWIEILPKSPLKGDTQNPFPIAIPHRFTHLRFKIYPDGGVARLRVHGEAAPDWQRILAARRDIDLAAVELGGRPITSSDQFFSSPQNLLMPGRAKNMGDCWETRRRRGPGFDWVILQLGTAGIIHRVEVDTIHFKGNYPDSCSLEACHAEPSAAEDLLMANLPWKEILPRTKLKAHTRQFFEKEIRSIGPATHVRFNIYPDGGVSRLRIFGAPLPPASWPEGLAKFNALSRRDAQKALLACCGSTKWVRQMAEGMPFESVPQLLEAAGRIWAGVQREDWLEAFRHHPKIGEKKAAKMQSAQARQWSKREQSTARKASSEPLAKLAQANRAYEARFGYIFIVCAAGKTSEEILAILEQRLSNDLATELRAAAEEQHRITRLRLEKLLEP
jgi:allantoicase